MASIQLVQSLGLTSIELSCLFTPIPDVDDSAIALARAVMVALNTDRRALADDVLPLLNSDDRRGWWGDLAASEIWQGWPIGCRLWLMRRDKITEAGFKGGATVEKARRFIVEALQPFVDLQIASGFDVELARPSRDAITGTITIYRGPKTAIALQFQDLWANIEA